MWVLLDEGVRKVWKRASIRTDNCCSAPQSESSRSASTPPSSIHPSLTCRSSCMRSFMVPCLFRPPGGWGDGAAGRARTRWWWCWCDRGAAFHAVCGWWSHFTYPSDARGKVRRGLSPLTHYTPATLTPARSFSVVFFSFPRRELRPRLTLKVSGATRKTGGPLKTAPLLIIDWEGLMTPKWFATSSGKQRPLSTNTGTDT